METATKMIASNSEIQIRKYEYSPRAPEYRSRSMTEKQIKLLTIEDKSLTTNLDRQGYRKKGVVLRIVGSYKEVLDYLDENKEADVVVINYDYDQIDPIPLIKTLKSHEKLQETPMIVTSVQSSAKVRKQVDAAGADLFVEQPVPRDLFIEKVKNLLEHQTRNNKRIEGIGDCEVTWEDGTVVAKVGDLSNSGVLVSTTLPLDKGTQVSLKMTIPGYKRDVKITGEVVRFIEAKHSENRPSGTGIRFVELGKEDQRKLEKFIDKEHNKDTKMIYYL